MVEFTMKGHKYTINDIPIFKFKWLGVDILKKIVSSTYRNTEVDPADKIPKNYS